MRPESPIAAIPFCAQEMTCRPIGAFRGGGTARAGAVADRAGRCLAFRSARRTLFASASRWRLGFHRRRRSSMRRRMWTGPSIGTSSRPTPGISREVPTPPPSPRGSGGPSFPAEPCVRRQACRAVGTGPKRWRPTPYPRHRCTETVTRDGKRRSAMTKGEPSLRIRSSRLGSPQVSRFPAIPLRFRGFRRAGSQYARQDLNLQPLAPEANALSN